MTSNIPPNPFERSEPTSDPRNSRLFATHETNTASYSAHDSQRQDSPKSSMPVMSARRKQRLKHSQLRRNILIGISVAIGLILALIATDTIKLGTGPKPTISQSIGKSKQLPTVVAGEQIESIRPLSGDDPLRVYVAGDSLVGSYAAALGASLGESGVIKTTYDSRPSSGLVNTDFFNWNRHAKQAVAQYKPEIVVFMIGTNDAAIVSSNPNGYVSDYTEKLNSFVDAVSGKDRKIIFVLAPAMRENALDRNLNKLNTVISSVAKQRQALLVDSSDVLSPNGKFSITLKVGGKSLEVRAGDGVHITGSGGKLLAQLIQEFLETSFGINKYSDSPSIKPVKVPGCCTSPTSIPSGTENIRVSTTTTTSSSAPATTTSSSVPKNDDDTSLTPGE